MTAIRAVVSKSGADLRRVFVVADRSQLCWHLECTLRPSPIRGIALTDGWFANSEIQGSEGAGLSVLLLDQTPSTTAKALRESKPQITRLSGGFWAPLPTVKSDKSPDDGEKRALYAGSDTWWAFPDSIVLIHHKCGAFARHFLDGLLPHTLPRRQCKASGKCESPICRQIERLRKWCVPLALHTPYLIIIDSSGRPDEHFRY